VSNEHTRTRTNRLGTSIRGEKKRRLFQNNSLGRKNHIPVARNSHQGSKEGVEVGATTDLRKRKPIPYGRRRGSCLWENFGGRRGSALWAIFERVE